MGDGYHGSGLAEIDSLEATERFSVQKAGTHLCRRCLGIERLHIVLPTVFVILCVIFSVSLANPSFTSTLISHPWSLAFNTITAKSIVTSGAFQP